MLSRNSLIQSNLFKASSSSHILSLMAKSYKIVLFIELTLICTRLGKDFCTMYHDIRCNLHRIYVKMGKSFTFHPQEILAE